MDPAVVGVIGGLLGVILGFSGQYFLHRLQRKDRLTDAKRKVYTEYLRSVDASYAQADDGHRKRSEDEKISTAVAEIELLSGLKIAEPVRRHSIRVNNAHDRLAIAREQHVPEGDMGPVYNDINDAMKERQRSSACLRTILELMPITRRPPSC